MFVISRIKVQLLQTERQSLLIAQAGKLRNSLTSCVTLLLQPIAYTTGYGDILGQCQITLS